MRTGIRIKSQVRVQYLAFLLFSSAAKIPVELIGSASVHTFELALEAIFLKATRIAILP